METSNVAQPDIVVIGGGPAGSTVSALLTRRGMRVVLAEKDKHPRFHIGESLLPLNLPLFDTLGVAEEMAAIGMPKYGAQFVSTTHGKSIMYDFSVALDKNFPQAYQVRRSSFDKILIDNARRSGVEVHEECRVTQIDLAPPGQRSVVQAKSKSGQELRWEPRLVVDASGRDTLLANKLKVKDKNRKHASSALYGHFRGAERLPGREEGNITVFWFDHGWLWFIPLSDGTTSVGAVCWPYYLRSRKTDPTTFFLDTIKMCPPLVERLRNATLENGASATGNYSYTARSAYGDGYVLVGDSYAFIDPVFSSGVYLAMQGAFYAAEAIDTMLRHPERRETAMKRYDRMARHGVKAFTWFVYRMTSPSLRDMFMDPRNFLRIEEAMMSLLAGDVFRSRMVAVRLSVFKFIYYCFNLRHLRRSLAAWQRRKVQISTSPADSPAS